MVYGAISRVCTLDGLYLTAFDPASVLVAYNKLIEYIAILEKTFLWGFKSKKGASEMEAIVGSHSLGSPFFFNNFRYEHHRRKNLKHHEAQYTLETVKEKALQLELLQERYWGLKFCNTFPMEKPL